MKFGSLFSGIGGFDLGLERVGMKCVWQCEIDNYATKVLEKKWPDVKRYKDVKQCGQHNLESVDLICGGFPCQPHSVAGKRKASADERDLWGEFARIINEIKPRWVLAENVPGLLSSEHGRFFGRVLRDLATCGYDAEWQCIPASAFGAPHRRDRVWIVANNNGKQLWGKQKLFKEQQNAAITTNNRDEESLANTNSVWKLPEQREYDRISNCSEAMAYSDSTRCKGYWNCAERRDAKKSMLEFSSWWKTEPSVGRVANGISSRVDRLKCLGNAVVPQIVEWIGRKIIEQD